MKLEKRKSRFSADETKIHPKLKSFHAPQRSHVKLTFEQPAEFGMPQEMPPRA